MSDTSEGPGWWKASDGKWYPPELYPADWPRPGGGDPSSDPAETAETAEPSTDPAPTADDPGQTTQVTAPGALGWGAPVSAPPDDPTLVSGVAPVGAGYDPTTVQPAVGQPAVGQPAAPPTWDQPPGAPPTTPPAWVGQQQPPVAGASGAANVPAAIAGIVGGLLLIVGSFFDWAEVTVGDGTASVNAISQSSGGWSLACGAILIVLSALLFMGQKASWIGALMIVTGLVAVGVFVFSYIDLGNLQDRVIDSLNEVDRGDLADTTTVERSAWLWPILIGGIVGTAAGGLALAKKG